MTDRSKWLVRRMSLAEEGQEPYLHSLSPKERVAMVWPITLQAWAFKEALWDAPRLRRDVVRVIRRGC
jgi:hypothetical protein